MLLKPCLVKTTVDNFTITIFHLQTFSRKSSTQQYSRNNAELTIRCLVKLNIMGCTYSLDNFK